MRLSELIVQGRVRDRGQVKNPIEALLAELLAPVQFRQILRDEIAFVAREILEIARAEIIDHRQLRVRIFFLEREDEIGTDKAGAAGDEKVEGRGGHRNELPANHAN